MDKLTFSLLFYRKNKEDESWVNEYTSDTDPDLAKVR